MDATVAPTPPDDETIPSEAILLRRVNPRWYTGAPGERRMTSEAFEDSKDGSAMSVHVLAKLEEMGLGAMDVVAGHEGYGLVSLSAAAIRELGFGVVWAPDPNDGLRGLAHAGVHCKKTESKRHKLRARCTHLAGELATDA